MAIEIMEDGFIRDSFEMGKSPLIYKDSIILPADEYNALTPDEIQALKQKRYDNWYTIITTPPAEMTDTPPQV